MDALRNDFRYAWRMLRKNLSMTLVIVLSLAIGIGANSAIFSVVDALLLRPLPYPQPERLAAIWLRSPGIGMFRDWPSPGQYIDLQNENRSFDEIAIAQSRTATLTGFEKPERIDVLRTSSNLLRMLGAKLQSGRLLLTEDDKPGKAQVALLSSRLWRQRFSADSQMIGKSLTLDGKQITVAGVLTPEFRLDAEVLPSEVPLDKIDIFLPLPLGADAAQKRGDENYNLVARLKPVVSVAQAQADVNGIANRIRLKDKRDRTFGMTVIGLQEQIVGDVRRTVLVLLGSVTLVLLIACANVANLLLTRATGRQKEMAIRLAVGAHSARIIGQLLTESLLLSLVGGALGLLIASLSIQVVRVMNPGNIPRLADIGIDGTVVAFTFVLSVATGILFGFAPAWRSHSVDLNVSLKTGGRSGESEGGFRLARHRMRSLLVISELALSVMLLVAAGLLIRSFVSLHTVPPGFSTDHVLSMKIVASGPKYQKDKDAFRFFLEVLARVTNLPGVKSAGLTSALPLTGTVGWGQINVEGYNPPPGQELQVDVRSASGDYFRTMQIPLVKGRFFSDEDRRETQQVAIIDETFARRFWPRDNPVGKHLWFDDPKKQIAIAGVVKVVKHYGLDNEDKIAVYFPESQQTYDEIYLVVRTIAEPQLIARPIVSEVHAVDQNVVVAEIQTMQERLYHSLARQRFATSLLFAFAVFALLLATVGVYGVLAYLVSQNRREIGLRIALGASTGHVVSLIIGYGMGLAVIGIACGLAGAISFTRLMGSLLFGVTPTDPLTFGAVIFILGTAALAATILPAIRAARVDPMVALRQE
jgi:predicted permease